MIIEEDAYLEHYGVKGMKWGVRKDKDTYGSIHLKKGTKLQRVVRRSDSIWFKAGDDLGDEVTYSSFTKRDNLTYETMLGRRKSLFTKKASEVLTLTATTDLRSPSKSDAASMFFKTLNDNVDARQEVESDLKERSLLFSRADVEKAIKDPTSPRAQSLYAYLYNKANYQSTPSVANRLFHEEVKRSGYNMLLDTTDEGTGISTFPVIILDPKKNVVVSGKRIIDKASQKSAREALRDLDKISLGKAFLQR